MTRVVHVLWWSRKQDVVARGYWDQSWLEDVLAPSTWRDGVEVVHVYAAGDVPAGATVLLVVPARHHADRASVEELRFFVGDPAHERVVVMLTGDEEHRFPVHAIEGHVHLVWVQNPSSRVARSKARVLGCGYTTHVRTAVQATPAVGASQRDLVWSFQGQVTHARRREFAGAARSLAARDPMACALLESAGFTQGVDRELYADTLLRSMVVPAPSGPVSPDTFRLFEALEAGCVPIGDEWTDGTIDAGYLNALFGDDVPFETLVDWRQLAGAVSNVHRQWLYRAARTLSWWVRYKNRMARLLWTDLLGYDPMTVDDEITVLVSTSLHPACPDTRHVEATIGSIRARLPRARIVVMVDGVRAEQLDRVRDLDEYAYRLAWLANTKWRNVDVVVHDDHYHQGLMARRAMERDVVTPFVLFVEHDTPLVGEVPFEALVEPLRCGLAHVIRLHHEAGVHPEHAWLSPTTVPEVLLGVPLVPTMQWSQRPHLARSDVYRELLTTHIGAQSRTFIEDVLHGVFEVEWREEGVDAWAKRKLWLYAPDGSWVRSSHTDAREHDPKFDLVYAYDGDTPFGAPRPTAER